MNEQIAPIDNLYDSEIKQINDLYTQIFNKWKTRQNNKQNLMEFHREVIYKFEEIGFDVDVDFFDYLEDIMEDKHPPRPPVLVIIGRVEPIQFDHEIKAHEVRKSKEG